MAQYIDKDALVAEIKRRFDEYSKRILKHYDACKEAKAQELGKILTIIDTLEVKEVDLEKEIQDHIKECLDIKFPTLDIELIKKDVAYTAKKFFKLGLSVNNPVTAADRGTAEEIIINLKRVEQDYRIDLTKEIEWARNQVKKGE